MASYSSTAVSRAPRERSMAARESASPDLKPQSAASASVPHRVAVAANGAPAPATIAPIDSVSFKQQAYAALRNVIVSLDVYKSRADIRLDERKLAQDFGISRTPVREALAQLEREGFVRSVPRRGVYVVRKT
jgi:hypothetical protein